VISLVILLRIVLTWPEQNKIIIFLTTSILPKTVLLLPGEVKVIYSSLIKVKRNFKNNNNIDINNSNNLNINNGNYDIINDNNISYNLIIRKILKPKLNNNSTINNNSNKNSNYKRNGCSKDKNNIDKINESIINYE